MADQTSLPRPSESRSSFSRTSPCVLLIDDDHDSREMYELALGYHGVAVMGAANADEGLRMVCQVRPDVIVTDLSLPDMDGYELLRRLRQEHGNTLPPIMVLTGWTGRDYEKHARAAGCAKVLTKPCPPDDLLAQILAALGLDGRSRSSCPS